MGPLAGTALGIHGASNIHASCITHNGRGLLIFGQSGAGKSTLALQMIALGCQLVADDRCNIAVEHAKLIARAPRTIAGLIEARGLGILRLPYVFQSEVVACVDVSEDTTTPPPRLPARRSTAIAGIDIDFLHFQSAAHFPSLVMCYLMGTYSS
jgi:HPr kinase/phosphorylase